MNQGSLFKILAILFLFEMVSTCNRYKVKVLKMENCAGDDGIITFDSNFTIKLNKNCELIPSGCVTNKGFGSATVKYKVKRNRNVMREGVVDMCAKANDMPPDAKKLLGLFGAPTKCPTEAQRMCNDGQKLDLSRYQHFLNLARGNDTIKAEIEHDTGKSCLYLKMQVKRI